MNSGSTLRAGLASAFVDRVTEIGEMAGQALLSGLPASIRPLKPEQAPEVFGPTDITAQLGNQGLSVGINRHGTISLFKWPRPSFYNQLKYHTTDRDKPYWGADPNAGVFLGLSVTLEADPHDRTVTWLRDWDEISQTHPQVAADTLKTTYRSERLDLTVTITDVVPLNDGVTTDRSGELGAHDGTSTLDGDALLRRVTVERGAESSVTDARLVLNENFDSIGYKLPLVPVADWGVPALTGDRASYEADIGAVVHTATGTRLPGITADPVHVAAAFGGEPDDHAVGSDEFLPRGTGLRGLVGAIWGESTPADGPYSTIDQTGSLPEGTIHHGHTSGVLTTPLEFSDGQAETRVVLAAGSTKTVVRRILNDARAIDIDDAIAAKAAWFDTLLSEAPLPDGNDRVRDVATRALVTLVLNYDPRSGAYVSSIATQSPYGFDWPRAAAFYNHVLDHYLGLHDWVERRNLRWYPRLQVDADTGGLRGLVVPNGNWSMNYYADGAVGGPIPWQIDETGFAMWTLWDHYTATGDRDYLRGVYPTLRRSAEFLVEFRDPTTGLQRPASEDDHPKNSQTVRGAATTWLGLDVATKAARELDNSGDATRYQRRRDELGRAINRQFWNESEGCWGIDHWGYPELAWPVGYRPFDDPQMADHLEAMWRRVEPTFDQPSETSVATGGAETGIHDTDERVFGIYETKYLIGLAKAWQDDPERHPRVERGVEWIAREWAMDQTMAMGEIWMIEDGAVTTSISQPHNWAQTGFYQAAVETFPPDE